MKVSFYFNKWPPHTRITLGQHLIDNNNRMIRLTGGFCVLLKKIGASNIWLLSVIQAADSTAWDKKNCFYFLFASSSSQKNNENSIEKFREFRFFLMSRFVLGNLTFTTILMKAMGDGSCLTRCYVMCVCVLQNLKFLGSKKKSYIFFKKLKVMFVSLFLVFALSVSLYQFPWVASAKRSISSYSKVPFNGV